MKNSLNLPIDRNTIELATKILGDESRVLGLLGQDNSLPKEWKIPPKDSLLPINDRLKEYYQELKKHIEIITKQADELGDIDYRKQAEGEVIAILVCIRELFNFFPEIWDESFV